MKSIAKIAVFALVAASVQALCGQDSNIRSQVPGNDETRVIALSQIEWERVKKEVDNKGASHIQAYNTTIMVTNAHPHIIHHIVPRGGNRRRVPVEPVPYVGQTF